MNIKHHKELRWLIFLLGPFIIMFGIHILVPLFIKVTDHGLSAQNYNYDIIQLQKYQILSAHYLNAKAVTYELVSYFNYLDIILTIEQQNQTAFLNVTINNSTQPPISAYQYALSNSQGTVNNSMWFATGVKNHSLLQLSQLQLLNQYLAVQPYIQSLLFSQNSTVNPIDSISFYMNNSDDSIYAQYPTQYNANFTELDYQVLDNYFYQTVNVYQTNNNTPITIAFYQFEGNANQTNKSMLVLCRPSISPNSSVVACMRLKINILGEAIAQRINVGQGQYYSSALYLVLSNDFEVTSSINPRILLEYLDPTSLDFQTPQNSYYDVNDNGLNSEIFNTVLNDYNKKLYLQQSNFTNYFISPIRNTASGSVLHLLTQSTINESQLVSGEINSFPTYIIIPVTLLVALASIINAIILKILLSSVDKELSELDERCKFIVDGDINVDIASFFGTKDIKQLYDRVKIINKLHRYSDQNYFTGHFSEKVLKYNEALQFIRQLDYDPGNLLQNMGQSYYYLQQWNHSIKNLKESVELILQKIEHQFGTIDKIYLDKIDKVQKKPLPLKYREMELILIRRLFKLNYTYVKYLELGQMRMKQGEINSAKIQSFKTKFQRYMGEFVHYTDLIKKALYPNASKLSEGIITVFYQIKQSINNKQYTYAEKQERKAIQFLKMYRNNYKKDSQLMRQKGSSHKLFFLSNKLTYHSRANPDLLLSIQNLVRAYRINAAETSPEKYNKIIDLFCQTLEAPIFLLSTSHVLMVQFRKTLIQLGINPEILESTQIFKQFLPYMTLCEEITKENEPQLLRMAKKEGQGLEREFILLFDCERNLTKLQKEVSTNCDYFMDQTHHLFGKLIRGQDRISIIKFNSKEKIKIQCNLILKQSNEKILKKEIQLSVRQRNYIKTNENEVFEALEKAVWRIKHLSSEKVIIIFFRSLTHYIMHLQKAQRKRKSTARRGTVGSQSDDVLPFDIFGDYVMQLLNSQGLRNLKLVCFCAKEDSIAEFNHYFGLEHINRRIWDRTGGINKNNNVVYVIEERHKTDIDRVLMLKALDMPDNNIFVL